MKKRLIAVCVLMMLLVGCGGKSVNSGAQETDAPNNIIVQGNDKLEGQDWQESFTLTRDDGENIGVSVNVVTTSIGENAYSIYEFTDSYDYDELVRLILPEGSIVCATEYEVEPKPVIQSRIELYEQLKAEALREPDGDKKIVVWDGDREYNAIEYYEMEIATEKARLDSAPDDYTIVTEYGDNKCYYAVKDGKRLGWVYTKGPSSSWYYNFVYNKDMVIPVQFRVDDEMLNIGVSEPYKLSDNQEAAKEYVNKVCNELNMDEMELYEVSNSEASVAALWGYPHISNAYNLKHWAITTLVQADAGDKLYYFTVTPAKFTNTVENVSLLSFEEAKNAVKANVLNVKNLRLASLNEINKMELTLTPVYYEGGGSYVPAWVINDGWLVINAIDGSFISSNS